MAQWIAPKRSESCIPQTSSNPELDRGRTCRTRQLITLQVLEIGTFTGFSALAFYKGTRGTNSKIVTMDVRGEVLQFTRKMIGDLGADDRIDFMEGPAAISYALPLFVGAILSPKSTN